MIKEDDMDELQDALSAKNVVFLQDEMWIYFAE